MAVALIQDLECFRVACCYSGQQVSFIIGVTAVQGDLVFSDVENYINLSLLPYFIFKVPNTLSHTVV